MESDAPSALRAPVLTLPLAEAEAVVAACEGGQTIPAYGSGGSTAVAASLPGRVVFSVESDAEWLAGLAEWFSANPRGARLHLHHADVGPTGKWGVPRDARFRDAFPAYAMSVWDRPDFVRPDVVLTDGRLHVGCLLSAVVGHVRSLTAAWEDHVGRRIYWAIGRFVRPRGFHGRVARFAVTPVPVPPSDIGWIVTQFAVVK